MSSDRRRVHSRPRRSRSNHNFGSRVKSTSVHRSQSREHVSDLKQGGQNEKDKLKELTKIRDNYLDFLKQKYPQWGYAGYSTNQQYNRLPGQTYDYTTPVPTYPPPRTPIVSRLETSQYFWNRGPPEAASILNNASSQHYRSVELLPVAEPIPTSNLYLEADLPNVRERLAQIRTHLDELKDFRLSMPTTEYFRKVAPDLRADLRNVKSYYGPEERADIPSLAELRAKILNLDLNVERRTREILDEAYGRNRWNVSKPMTVPQVPDTVAMPDWLKAQPPSAVEDLINNTSEKIETVLKPPEQPVAETQSASIPQQPQLPPPPMPKVEEKPKSPEPVQPVIASSRSFVLPGSTNLTKQKDPVSTKQPKPSSSSDSDEPVPEKPKPAASYNTLLELLKPKKIEVSTDSSDSDATELVFGPKSKTNAKPPSLTPKPPVLSTTTPPVKTAPANDLLSKLKLPPATAADSDDDFFN